MIVCSPFQLAPEVEDALLVVGESGTTYELNIYTSDNPHRAVVIFLIYPKPFRFRPSEQKKYLP